MTERGVEENGAFKSIVVLDTNVWLSTKLLNTPVAAALLFALRRAGRLIGLPEVVETEIVKNVRRAGQEAVAQVRKGYDAIGVLMGTRDDYRVPTEDEFGGRITERLAELVSLLHRVPFTADHAREALRRVNEESPPNGPKNQQFKDSAIWEAVRELAATGTAVDLITDDRGFFENRDTGKGMARNLAAECAEGSLKIRLFPELDAYLGSLKQELPAFDTAKIAQRIASTVDESLRSHALAKGFEVGSLESHKLSAFVTERINTLALSWALVYEGFDPADPAGPDVVGDRILVRGSAYLDYVADSISKVQLQAIEYRKFTGELVGPKSQQNVWLSGAIVLGRGAVRHEFKEPVDL